MAELDIYIKKLLQDRKIFADLYNAELFQGRQVIHAEDLTPVPNESGLVFIDSKGVKKTIRRHRDKVMKASFGAALAVMATEGQGEIHYGMPVRNMTYDALDYTEQIQELEKQHKEAGGLSDSGEFLSRIAKKNRLVPIINIVLYYGKKPWDGPCSLYDMMELDHTWDGFEEIKDFLPSYRIHVVDVRNIKELNRFQTGLQQVFSMLKYNSDKQKLYDYATNNREEIRNLGDDAMAVMLALLGEQKRLLKIFEELKGEENKDMCVAIDELIEDGKAEGESRMADLVAALLSDKRTDLLTAAVGDKLLRAKLFEQYHI